jgi:beta-lactamase class A
MASTCKIAIAGTTLKKVDDGTLTLSQMLEVPFENMIRGTLLSDNMLHPGVSLSLVNLIELMLTQSDNTATDVVLAAAGGPEEVTVWLRSQGIRRQRVDRDIASLILSFLGLSGKPFSEVIAKARKENPRFEEARFNPKPSFDDDPRDTTTPADMTRLLGRLFRGEALSAASTSTLVAIMERCLTGPTRLKGRMPPGTVIAHKTGTIGGTANDAGVLTLPDDRGQIIISAYIKKSPAPMESRDFVIADVARAIRDFYMFAG